MSGFSARVQFEQEGSRLTAVEIQRTHRSTVITALQRALFALGIVVSSYQVRTTPNRVVERLVIARQNGASVEGELSAATKATILPIALEPGELEAGELVTAAQVS